LGTQSQPRLIVGLGNPLDQYRDTRHNVGRQFLQFLAAESNSKFKKIRQAEGFRLPDFFGVPLEEPVLCVFLNCFMNQSGGPLAEILKYESLLPENMIVVADDFMIPFGSLRLRSSGSAGGHNGLKSVIEALGTEEFGRLRVGIGPVPVGQDPAEFVLKKFSKEELAKRAEIYQLMQKGLIDLFSLGYDKSMTALNKVHF